MANFTGDWVLSRQLGFDAFAASQGVPWLLRKLATLDRPAVIIDHVSTPPSKAGLWSQGSSGGAEEVLSLTLTEAQATQHARWALRSAAGQEASIQRLHNPLREATDVAMGWSPRCPGVIEEFHVCENPRNSVRMFRWLRLRDKVGADSRKRGGEGGEGYDGCSTTEFARREEMVVTMVSEGSAVSERVFERRR